MPIRGCNTKVLPHHNNYQDIQCTYNTTALLCNHCCCWKTLSITYSEWVYSLWYPSCNVHAHMPYWHLWPAWFHNIFPHYLRNGKNSQKKLLNKKWVLWFSLQLSSKTFLILRQINPLNAELNPICYLLALLGAHHFLHVSRIRVKSLTLRLLSYIYIYIYTHTHTHTHGAPILDVSRSHTTTQHSR